MSPHLFVLRDIPHPVNYLHEDGRMDRRINWMQKNDQSSQESRYKKSRNPKLRQCGWVDCWCKKLMGLLSIQTQMLEIDSYDFSTTMTGIFLVIIHHCFCNTWSPTQLVQALKTSLEKINKLILEKPFVWFHIILVEK